MPHQTLSRLSCALIVAAAAHAQIRVAAVTTRTPSHSLEQPPLRAPSLGHYLFDGRLRLIAGLPGAAISLPSPAPYGFHSAAEPPSRAFLLAIDAESHRALLLFDTPDGVSVSRALETAAPAERLLLSPSGAAAAVRTSAAWEIWTGLPLDPQLHSTLDAHDAPAAVSDSGELLLAGFSPRLAALEDIAAVAFRPGSQDAIAATPHGIFLLQDSSIEPLPLPLPEHAHIVALANPGAVAEINPRTHESRTTACDCTPALLVPIDGKRLFRLTEPSAESPNVLLYDGAAAEPRILFVAAPAAEPTGGIE
jgi:hypothetical protein